MRRSTRLVPLATALLALAATASTAATPATSFVFGRSGGNIRPYTVMIAANGKVTAAGAVQLAVPDLTLPPEALRGLAKLATAEGFQTLAHTIRCPRTLPDVAGRFVTVRSGGVRRSVTEIGSCTPGFDELYAVLAATAGVRG